MFCPKCGQSLTDQDKFCKYCGASIYGEAVKPDSIVNDSSISDKSRTIDLVLACVCGAIGVHKFYEGKVGLGILYIFTVGLFGIGVLIDIIQIACGNQLDSDGKKIVKWDA